MEAFKLGSLFSEGDEFRFIIILCTDEYLYISWMVLFTTFGYTNSFGVYQALYTLEGTSTASNISWIGSLQVCLRRSQHIYPPPIKYITIVVLHVLNRSACWQAL